MNTVIYPENSHLSSKSEGELLGTTMLSNTDSPKLRAEEDERRHQQKPKSIALAIFRFRARRGVGVYYSLLSTVPLLVGVLTTISLPAYFTFVSVGLLVLGILFLARLAGMKRLYEMNLVMELVERKSKSGKGNSLKRFLFEARTVLVTLLPLFAAAVFQVTGDAFLGAFMLLAFAGYVIGYYLMVFSKKAAESILPWRVEDWLAAVLPPALLVMYFFQFLDTLSYLISLILLFLLMGVKSSYEAPQVLMQVLNDSDNLEASNSARKLGSLELTDLPSSAILSSFSRLGIMLTLLGVGRITFMDLLFAVKASKSSLNHSVNALEEAGYVRVRKGFNTAGGPRTFIEITSNGKEAVRAHLESMQAIATRYLT